MAHIIKFLLTRRNSSAWNSAEELLLLAQTSRQEDMTDLRNTSLGIQRLSTMGLNARIRVTTDSGSPEPIQLVVSAPRDDHNMGRVVEDWQYGSD